MLLLSCFTLRTYHQIQEKSCTFLLLMVVLIVPERWLLFYGFFLNGSLYSFGVINPTSYKQTGGVFLNRLWCLRE